MKSPILLLFVFLSMSAGCENLLYTGGKLDYLSVLDINLSGDDIEILVMHSRELYNSSIVGHHSSKSVFKKGDLFSTGKISLSKLLSSEVKELELHKVGELRGRLTGLSLSIEYPKSILVKAYKENTCDKFRGVCRRVKSDLSFKRSDIPLSVRLGQTSRLIYIEYAEADNLKSVVYSKPFILTSGSGNYELLIVEKNGL